MRNGGGGVGGSYGPPGHYPIPPGVGCDGQHSAPGGGDGGPPVDPYGSGSESTSSSELERRWR